MIIFLLILNLIAVSVLAGAISRLAKSSGELYLSITDEKDRYEELYQTERTVVNELLKTITNKSSLDN